MTTRLYQDDSYLTKFSAKIKKINNTDSGWEIRLNQTAFYPESGGQLYDTGELAGFEVVNVYQDEDGDIVHVVNGWDDSISGTVVGIINEKNRLANMRKHTGQHILSQSFERCCEARTVSAHLGQDFSTIELSVESLDNEQLNSTERLANETVFKDLPIDILYLEHDELSKYPIRKIPEREGKFRIIKIGEFDYTACGGTHCSRTGEVGLIKIVSTEKIRGHLRVAFLTGMESVEDYQKRHDIITDLSTRYTCGIEDIGDRMDKLSDQNKELKGQISELNKRLMPYEADSILSQADVRGDTKVVTGRYDNRDPGELKDLALTITRENKAVVVFGTNDKMVISASKDSRLRASEIAREIMKEIGGKGGGSDIFAQVGAIPLEKRDEKMDNISGILKSLLKE